MPRRISSVEEEGNFFGEPTSWMKFTSATE
jgi:hypothetical protein